MYQDSAWTNVRNCGYRHEVPYTDPDLGRSSWISEGRSNMGIISQSPQSSWEGNDRRFESAKSDLEAERQEY